MDPLMLKRRRQPPLQVLNQAADKSSTFNQSNNLLNDDDGFKTAKTNKSNVKLLNQSDVEKENKQEETPEGKAEKAVRDYQLELEKNIGLPKYFKNLFYLSPQMKEKYYILKKKLKIIDSFLCILSVVAILLSIYDTDLVAVNYNIFENEFVITNFNNICRIFVLIVNIISVYLIILRYKYLLDEHILKVGTIANCDNFLTANLLSKLLLEVFVNLVFNPPVVNTHFEMKGTIFVVYDYSTLFNSTYLSFHENSTVIAAHPEAKDNATLMSLLKEENLSSENNSIRMFYNVSPVITFFILLRIYHFFRVIHTFSYWNTLQAQSVCKNMKCEADISFGLRAYLKMKPFIALTFCVAFVIIFFGIGETIFEYYNKAMTDIIAQDKSIHSSFVATMHKFENMYNSFWLILVTMSTIGYGDIYPSTYFGRALAFFACMCGTFIMSLLVVFLNNAISFDEVEKHVYNEIIDEKFSIKAVQKEAVKLIYKSLEYNYLRRVYPKQTALYRFKLLYVDLKYMTRHFKMRRIVSRKNEIDIDEILGALKYNLDYHITPFKNSIDEYNRERLIFDHSFNYLKDSTQICDEYNKNSMQIVNLLKIMNKEKYLDNLNSIGEVYDSQVNIIEEVVYYHKFRAKLDKIAVNDEENVSESGSEKTEGESKSQSKEDSDNSQSVSAGDDEAQVQEDNSDNGND